MKKSEKQLLEAAAKILRGEYALNEAQAPDDFEGEYDDEKSPSTLELISKRKGLRGEQEESTELEEAKADVSKVLKVGKSLGGKVYGNQIDFGQGAVIKVSASGNKIKFDGGLSSGKEEFDSVEDAIAALKKGSDKYESTELQEKNSDLYKWEDINDALMKAGLGTRVIMKVISALKGKEA